jgi:hypothetical protein
MALEGGERYRRQPSRIGDNDMNTDILSTFAYSQDPGHGWILVPMPSLEALGLTEADISPYSYRDPAVNLVALEEDMDASTFIRAFIEKYGFEPRLVEDQDGGRIRNWPKFGTRTF